MSSMFFCATDSCKEKKKRKKSVHSSPEILVLLWAFEIDNTLRYHSLHPQLPKSNLPKGWANSMFWIGKKWVSIYMDLIQSWWVAKLVSPKCLHCLTHTGTSFSDHFASNNYWCMVPTSFPKLPAVMQVCKNRRPKNAWKTRQNNDSSSPKSYGNIAMLR